MSFLSLGLKRSISQNITNLFKGGNRQIFFIIKEAKETALNLSKRTVKLP